MEIRYLGFDQKDDERAYRFDVRGKGDLPRQVVVTTTLSLFHAHRVAIQDGPSLCARKLAADLEGEVDGTHELTREDFRLHAAELAAAEAKRLEKHQHSPKRPKHDSTMSPWRRGGL